MTHSLIITAHPSSKGFTHEIAHAYINGLQNTGKTGEIMNLYTPEWKQDYLSYEDVQTMNTLPKVQDIQSKITKALLWPSIPSEYLAKKKAPDKQGLFLCRLFKNYFTI